MYVAYIAYGLRHEIHGPFGTRKAATDYLDSISAPYGSQVFEVDEPRS